MASIVQLDGNTLSPAEVYAVASENIEIKLSEDSWNRIVKSRKVVEDILESGDVVFGINTGFGSLVDTNISIFFFKKFIKIFSFSSLFKDP